MIRWSSPPVQQPSNRKSVFRIKESQAHRLLSNWTLSRSSAISTCSSRSKRCIGEKKPSLHHQWDWPREMIISNLTPKWLQDPGPRTATREWTSSSQQRRARSKLRTPLKAASLTLNTYPQRGQISRLMNSFIDQLRYLQGYSHPIWVLRQQEEEAFYNTKVIFWIAPMSRKKISLFFQARQQAKSYTFDNEDNN